jgi:hypothetical protein
MKKEIRLADKEKGIVQITTYDERWYAQDTTDPATGIPTYRFVPSVTWITHFYPKGEAFLRWYAKHGWDEAEALKSAAGDKGSKIHLAIADLLEGNAVKIDSKYLNKSTGVVEELTANEYEAVMSFLEWYLEAKPEVVAFEYVVFNSAEGYAGTVDLKCKLGGEVWILDVKSGPDVHPEHELQVSAYKHAEGQEDVTKIGILQVGYKRNKTKKFKVTEVPDKFGVFLSTKMIWRNETEGVAVSQKDYPLSIAIPKKTAEKPPSGATSPVTTAGSSLATESATEPKAAKTTKKAA